MKYKIKVNPGTAIPWEHTWILNVLDAVHFEPIEDEPKFQCDIKTWVNDKEEDIYTPIDGEPIEDEPQEESLAEKLYAYSEDRRLEIRKATCSNLAEIARKHYQLSKGVNDMERITP
jgi:hypothetical protein